MKYLFIARGFNEPDNNTPGEQIWCKVVDCDEEDLARYEKVFTDEFNEDYEHGVEIDYEPLEVFEDEWFNISKGEI